jgi:deoxyribonuclease V
MKIRKLHRWDVSYEEAVRIQKKLREKLVFSPLEQEVSLIAGADISFSRKDPRLFAGVVVMKIPEMEIVEQEWTVAEPLFPYVPGFLAFREVPPLCEVFRKLKTKPDAVICDGQGFAHPRGMGLACHLGLFLDLPTVGCAKSRLVGEFSPPANERFAQSALEYHGETVGAVLRTRENVKPVYVSPGHRIDIEGSVELVTRCVSHYRLSEPIRQAHWLVNRIRKEQTV